MTMTRGSRMPDIWYHATPKKNCEAIEREGLRLGTTIPDYLTPGERARELKVDRQHFSRSSNIAEWVSEIVQGTPIDDMATYEVDLEGIELEPGWDDEENDCAIAVAVEPSRLRRVNGQRAIVIERRLKEIDPSAVTLYREVGEREIIPVSGTDRKLEPPVFYSEFGEMLIRSNEPIVSSDGTSWIDPEMVVNVFTWSELSYVS